MKTLLLNMICAILTISTSCNKQTHDNASEKQGESTLLEFYSKHFDIWKNIRPTREIPNARKEKLDSLMQKYCTSEVRNEAIKTYENVGADLLTQDRIGEVNENLKVEKAAGKENNYIVSFEATSHDDLSGKAIHRNVILHVTVVKEKGDYKIASVR